MGKGKWRNPLDGFKGEPRPQTEAERLDEIIAKTARPVLPVPAETPFNAIRVPSTYNFNNLLIPAGQTVIIREEFGATFDTFCCDYTDADQANFASNVVVRLLADDVYVCNIHSGVEIRVPGTRVWKVQAPSGIPILISGRLLSAVDYRWNSRLLYTLDDNDDFRPLKTSSNTGALMVNFSGLNTGQAFGNTETFLIAHEATQGVGHVASKAIGPLVNQSLIAGAAGSSWVVCSASLSYSDASGVLPVGDVIEVNLKFATGNPFITLVINTSFGADAQLFASHAWGTNGPVGGIGQAINYDLTRGALSNDGFRLCVLAKRFPGF